MFEEKCNNVQDKEVKEYLDEVLESLKGVHVIRHCEEAFMPTRQSSDVKSLISGLPQPLKGLRNDDAHKKSLAAKELIANQISLFKARTQIVGKHGNIYPKAKQVQANYTK